MYLVWQKACDSQVRFPSIFGDKTRTDKELPPTHPWAARLIVHTSFVTIASTQFAKQQDAEGLSHVAVVVLFIKSNHANVNECILNYVIAQYFQGNEQPIYTALLYCLSEENKPVSRCVTLKARLMGFTWPFIHACNWQVYPDLQQRIVLTSP